MSLLEELKEQRAEAAEHVADLDLEIKASAAALAQDQKEHAEWVQKLADIDRAIAALSVPEVAEVEIPDGFVKWEGGECPVKVGDSLRILWREGVQSGTFVVDDVWATQRAWEPGAHDDDIIAYRVLPIEPAAEAKGDSEGEVASAAGLRAEAESDAKMRDLLCLTFDERRGWDAHWSGAPISKCYVTPNAQGECEWCNGWNKREACTTNAQPRPITIASSQHAEESALAQSLPPLFPAEPPQAATPESLRAGGIVDSEASWWARKLAKEPA